MKLFQRLLVAPAALGLLAPIAANATEVNLDAISNYSSEEIELNSNSFRTLSSEKPLLISGGEGLVEDVSADSFSETTSASFAVDFAIGAVDGTGITTNDTDGQEAVEAYYGFQMDLTTSFTGEDTLAVSIDAGNSGGAAGEFDLNGPAATSTAGTTVSDGLTVDGVSYTFPLGGGTMIIGDNTDGSALFSKACVYGGPSDTLSDCGSPNSAFAGAGTAVGYSYDFDNGFTVAAGYAGDGSSTNGLMTDEGLDSYGLNAMYTGDTYGISVSYATLEQGSTPASDDTYTAVNAYWAPEGFPSVSVGYEWGEDGSEPDAEDGFKQYFVGIESEVGPGTLGAAMGPKTAKPEDADEQLMYEVYYSYPVNDGMTITPLVYVQENSVAGTPDQTGIMVKTSFSF